MKLSDFFSKIKEDIIEMEVPFEKALTVLAGLFTITANIVPDPKIKATMTIASNAANAMNELVSAAQTDGNAQAALNHLIDVIKKA